MRRPLLFVCVCLFTLMALGMHVFNPPPWDSSIFPRGEEVLLKGQVYNKEYREYEEGKYLILYLKSVSIQNSDFDSGEKIRCEISFQALPLKEDGNVFLPCLGAWVVVQGSWQEFAKATNPGEFDLSRYYGLEGIVAGIEDAELVQSSKSFWRVREALFQCRTRWSENLYGVFEPKEASILAKMLLGDGSGLDKEVRELYQSGGIAHILSISGLHISMLGMGLYGLLKRCGISVKGAAVLGGTVIVLYGMLTGFEVSACRAIGMYLIHMLGELGGKTYDMLTAMGVLCVSLLVTNPRLVYHSGYLLSFSSVCGVGLLAPVLQCKVGILQIRPYESNGRRWLKRKGEQALRGFTTSLAVTLFTLPIQLFFFYKVPVYSVIINLFVIPFVSLVMILGFVIMLFPAFRFLCPLETLIFAWFEWLCTIFQELPGHTWLTGRPDMWKVLGYYVVLLGVILGVKKIKKRYIPVMLATLVVFVGVRLIKPAKITFLDVGQGDCAVVQTKAGDCFLFDCGSSNKSKVGEKILVPYLQYEGIGEVDGVFLSHPDADHMNGVLYLLQESDICVKNLFLPDVKGAEAEFGELTDYVPKDNVFYVSAGMHLDRKNAKLTCLHPERNFSSEEDNAYSACYLLEMEGVCILFTGDVERDGEEALLEAWEKHGLNSVDVLKVAHHGSRFSTTEIFLEAICPEISVISCGRNNRYGHPHAETLERLDKIGSHVLITAEQGAVILEPESIKNK